MSTRTMTIGNPVNTRVHYSVIDACFKLKRKRYYVEHHRMHGPTFYNDKWQRSVIEMPPKTIWRRYNKWYRKHEKKKDNEHRAIMGQIDFDLIEQEILNDG